MEKAYFTTEYRSGDQRRRPFSKTRSPPAGGGAGGGEHNPVWLATVQGTQGTIHAVATTTLL